MVDREALLRLKYHGLCLPARLNLLQGYRVTSTVVPDITEPRFVSLCYS